MGPGAGYASAATTRRGEALRRDATTRRDDPRARLAYEAMVVILMAALVVARPATASAQATATPAPSGVADDVYGTVPIELRPGAIRLDWGVERADPATGCTASARLWPGGNRAARSPRCTRSACRGPARASRRDSWPSTASGPAATCSTSAARAAGGASTSSSSRVHVGMVRVVIPVSYASAGPEGRGASVASRVPAAVGEWRHPNR